MEYSNPKSSRYTIGRHIKDCVSRALRFIYALLDIPGLVRPIDYGDIVTGDHFCIRVDSSYTVVAINNREYLFQRTTGKFAGTGYVLRNSNEELLDCILADIHESKVPPSLWGRLRKLLQSKD